MPVWHNLGMRPRPLSELWVQGYRDGWKGSPPPLNAPKERINGPTAGNKDRRHGWAQPRYAHLTDRPPGEEWVERK